MLGSFPIPTQHLAGFKQGQTRCPDHKGEHVLDQYVVAGHTISTSCRGQSSNQFSNFLACDAQVVFHTTEAGIHIGCLGRCWHGVKT